MNFSVWLVIALCGGIVLAGFVWWLDKQRSAPEEESGLWCPKCGDQYRPGFSECADCHVKLTTTPPERPEPEYVDLVEVAYGIGREQSVLAESLLKANGIEYVIQNNTKRSPIRILVPSENASQARDLFRAHFE